MYLHAWYGHAYGHRVLSVLQCTPNSDTKKRTKNKTQTKGCVSVGRLDSEHKSLATKPGVTKKEVVRYGMVHGEKIDASDITGG